MGLFEDFIDAHVDVAEKAVDDAINNTIDELTGQGDDDDDD